MSEQVKSKRRYDASRRRMRAQDTKRAIVQAAHQLFVERGYSGSSMDAIAGQAGVAVETVYATFRNKRAVLARVMDVAIVGDEAPIALLDRTSVQSVRGTKDQRTQIEMFSHGIRQIMERAGPIFQVMRGAAPADPEIAQLLKGYLDKRREGMQFFVDALLSNGPLRPGLSLAEAVDTVWTISSSEVHHLLTGDRGWEGDRYERWLVESLSLLLLGKT
jgi:TetR/AcrR family transcriptional regulator of autoinduction and epiphytic fitness